MRCVCVFCFKKYLTKLNNFVAWTWDSKGSPKGSKSNFFPSGNILRAKTLLIVIIVLRTPDVTSIDLIFLENTTSVILYIGRFIWCIWFNCLASLTGLFRLLDYFSGSNATTQWFLRLCPSVISREHDHFFYISRLLFRW